MLIAQHTDQDLCLYVCLFVCLYGFKALTTSIALCARSQDSILSVSVRRVHVVFLSARFKGGGKPSHNMLRLILSDIPFHAKRRLRFRWIASIFVSVRLINRILF